MEAGVIVGYVLGCFAASYVTGRADFLEPHDDPFWWVVLWPLALVLLTLFSPIAICIWLHGAGQKRRAAK